MRHTTTKRFAPSGFAPTALSVALLTASALYAPSAFAAACATAWKEGPTYATGQVVSYQGSNYKALTSHTAYVGTNWNPVAAPTLWGKVETCSVTPTPTPPTPTPPTPTPPTPTPPTPTPPTPTPPTPTPPTPTPPTPTPPTPTPPTPTPPTPTPACSVAAWNSTAVYTGGQQASYQGYIYTAKWWTQGENPAAGTSGVWTKGAVCNTPTPPTPTPPTPTPPTPTPPTPTPPTPTPPSSGPVVGYVTATNWKGGANGAYSLLHDDLCAYITDGQINYAHPELAKRNLVAAFGIISSKCAEYHWTAAKNFIAYGHEIFSHTRNHNDANTAAWDSVAEIQGATQDIAAKLNYTVSYFAWPSDIAPDAPLAYLRSQANFIGGRAPNRVAPDGTIQYGNAAGVNQFDFADPFQVKWDLFTNSGIWSLYPQGSEILNLHVDAAINAGGWATRTAHGVNDSSWETIPLARYTGHLDYVKSKVDAGLLWVATPSQVIRYRNARQYCLPVLNGTLNGVTFNTSAAECQKYRSNITLQLNPINATAPLTVTQAGKTLTAVKKNGQFLVDVDPFAGPLTLR